MSTVEQALEHAELIRTYRPAVGEPTPCMVSLIVLADEVIRLRKIAGGLADPTWEQVVNTFGEVHFHEWTETSCGRWCPCGSVQVKDATVNG